MKIQEKKTSLIYETNGQALCIENEIDFKIHFYKNGEIYKNYRKLILIY